MAALRDLLNSAAVQARPFLESLPSQAALVRDCAAAQVQRLQVALSMDARSAAIGAAAVLALLVLLAAVRALWRAARFVRTYFGRSGRDPKSYGSWAVVTGATDGIGKAFTQLLAEKGMNIVLVSLPSTPLRECAIALQEQYGVQTRIVPADFCRTDEGGPEAVRPVVKGLQVGVLVNCAGIGYTYPEYLHAVPDQLLPNIVHVNAMAPTVLSKMVLPGMLARKRGLIINIGSAMASMPEAPMVAAYAATKAHLDAFTRALDCEYRDRGVRAQNLVPSFVATGMIASPKPSLMVPTPEAWAAAALRQVGHDTVIAPYWPHAIHDAFMRRLPAALVVRGLKAINLRLREQEIAKRAAAAAAEQEEAAAKAPAAAAKQADAPKGAEQQKNKKAKSAALKDRAVQPEAAGKRDQAAQTEPAS